MRKKAEQKAGASSKARKTDLSEQPVSHRPFEAVAKAAKVAKDARDKQHQEEKGRKAPSASRAASTAKTLSAPRASTSLERPSPGAASSHAASFGERETFAMYMAGVRSLEGGALRIPATASRIEKAELPSVQGPDLDAPARERLRSLVLEGRRFELSDDGGRLEGRRLDLDPRDLRRLRRGAFAIDGRLDLHGLGAAEARSSLEAFVKKRALDGDKVVLVIHGKGAHSAGGVGVLRGEIGAWLSQGLASRHVAAFTTAPAEEGGEGALLVLLAR